MQPSARAMVSVHHRRVSVGEAAGVFVIFTALSLIATFPLILRFDAAAIGGGDTSQNAWNLWWVQQGLAQGNFFPYHTQAIYHPLGVSLAYHPLGVFNGWISFLLQRGLGLNLAAAYNTIVLLSCAGTGLATYLLVVSLTQNRMAALVAGVIFTFAPIRMSRLFFGNLEMISTQFIPLMTLFFIDMVADGRSRAALWAALFFALTAWCSLYLAYGAGLLIVLLLVATIVAARGDLRAWVGSRFKALLLFAVLSLILVLPVVLPLARDYADFRSQADQTAAATSNSADLLGFFVPDWTTQPLALRLSPGVAEWVRGVYAGFFGNSAEKTVFLGYALMAVIVAALIGARPRTVWPWLDIAVVFLLLCLGPVLHVAGRPILAHLPYEWLSSIPLISFGRAPSRFALFLMLSLAVVVGYGLAALERKDRRFRWLTLAAGLLIFVEFLIVPVRMDARFAQIPPFYADLAAMDDDAALAVLDVPVDLVGAQGPAGEYMLYQTVHQRPIVSGYISRTPAYISALFDNPFIHALRARIYGDDAPYHFDAALLAQAPAELAQLRIGYVVLHRWALAAEGALTVQQALTSILAAPLYEDEQIVVWRTHNVPPE